MTTGKQDTITHGPSYSSYAHCQADHHRRMLSLLSIGPSDCVKQPVHTTHSPISPTQDTNPGLEPAARSSSVSSVGSLLRSPVSNTEDDTFMTQLYGASDMAPQGYQNPDEYGQQYNEHYLPGPPPYVNNSVYLSHTKLPTDTQCLDNHSAYGQLIDLSPSAGYSDVARPMYNPQESSQQFPQMSFSQGWNPAYGVNSLGSSFDPMANPYGYNPSLHYGLSGSSSSSSSITPPNHASFDGINPGCLSGHSSMHHDDVTDGPVNEVDSTLECPPSPLQSVSTSASPMPMPSDSEPLLKRSRGRRASESALANSGKNGKRAQKRKHTWTPGMAAEGPNVSAEQKIKELQDLDRLMAGGPAFRRERRRLQNRLAQRAFRARSKISNKEAANHMGDLEHLAEIQAEKLAEMSLVLAKLQKENNALKTTGQLSSS